MNGTTKEADALNPDSSRASRCLILINRTCDAPQTCLKGLVAHIRDSILLLARLVMNKTSRRGFLKTVGIAAAAPATVPGSVLADAKGKKAQRRTSFAPSSDLKKLSENLYLLQDTCNVYLVRDGSRGLLIDFGSGKILDYLPGLGISKIDWILHTHHHRDQCQGDYRAVERSIPIVVPAHELHLFADAENFWRNRRVFHLYYVRNDFNTLTENVPVASVLRDYGTFRWNNRDIFVLPTPGHTLGSVSLIMEIDGKKTAFTGDLMHSPGKLVNLWDTQVNYGGAEGIDLGSFSLARLREQKAACFALPTATLCPTLTAASSKRWIGSSNTIASRPEMLPACSREAMPSARISSLIIWPLRLSMQS